MCLFHLLMHSLVASCTFCDWGSNPQPLCIGTTLSQSHPARASCSRLVRVTVTGPGVELATSGGPQDAWVRQGCEA